MSNIFTDLNKVDISNHIKQKNKLNYLSWPYAWAHVVERYPESLYDIVKFEYGKPYYLDETGAMVYTKVTIDGITREMCLPVMDGANKSMKMQAYTYEVKDWYASKQQGKDVFKEKVVEAISMFDINKTIMRCLVKNLAMFGLGLNLYAGEDLPLNINDEEVLPLKTPNELSTEKLDLPKKPEQITVKLASAKQITMIKTKLKQIHADEAEFLRKKKIKKFEELNSKQASDSIEALSKYIEANQNAV